MEQGRSDSQPENSVELVSGYGKTHVKLTKFAYTICIYEITNFESTCMPPTFRILQSPTFRTNYKKMLVQWTLVSNIDFDNNFALKLLSLTTDKIPDCCYVRIEIFTTDSKGMNPIKEIFSACLSRVIGIETAKVCTFDNRLNKFANTSKLCENYLKNGSLIIDCKICFIDKENECGSGSIQAVQDIPVSDRRLQEFDDFERILEDTKFSDMMILVEGKQFHVHKVILASRSSVFAAMFEHNMKENIEREVKIDDIGHDVMKEVLRFIYAGKVNNIQNLACDLFVAADKYNLQGLKDMCEEVLLNGMSLDNTCEILAVIDHCKTNRLHSAAIKFVQMNAALLITQKELNATMISLLKNLCVSKMT